MWGKALTILTIVAISHAKPERRTEPSDQCPSDKHFLLPHEWDCTRFYYCEYGMKWIEPRLCAPGTEFSFELQVCIHPHLANCQLPGVPPTDGPEPTTPEPTTPEPTTPEPTTPEPTTPEPTTPEPTTPEPTTPEPTTPEPTTPEPTTPEPTTPEPTTPEPTTPEPTTPEPTTPEPTTPEPTTPEPTTPEPTTPEPTTPEPTTPEPTTPEPTTPEPTTPEPTTPEPTTPEPTTPEPTTPEPTTPEPTTPEPTTPEPTTPEPTTPEPTTPEPTTKEPTTPEPKSSSEELLKPSECPSDFSIHQLLPHETKCNLFYYCNFGEKYLRECASGTYFNPEIQVCDWPENVKCKNDGNSNENGSSDENGGSGENGSSDENSGSHENSGSGEDGGLLPNGCPSDFSIHQLLPHEKDCSKFYYCNFGEKVLTQCGEGTLFNSEIQVCDWPHNVKCKNDGNSNENGSSDENGGSGENGSSDENSGSHENSGSGEDGGLLPNGCPSDFSIHQLLPHEKDCSKFYYCNFGEKVLTQCGEGTLFNPEIQVCDWPHNVKCKNDGNSNENGSSDENGGSGENGSSDENSGSHENSGSGEDGSLLPNGCPSDFSIHQLLPHENDCSKFYYCNFGEKVLTQCGEGTLFNPEIQVCDWPHNVKCKNDGNSNENGSSDENSGSHENSGSGEDGGLLPNGCPSDFSIHQLLPHENDCSKFYYCNFGEKVLTQCGEGTLFNPEIQVCDWPHNVKCKNDGNSNENGSSDENGGSGENGSSDENSGSHENSGSGEDGGLLPNGCPSDFSIHQLLPHENDCSKFYYCNFGEKVLTQCGEGTLFNPEIQVCDWPHNVKCKNDGNSNENGSSDENSGSHENSGSGEDGGLLPNGCPSDFSIHQLLPHEKDCSKFYYCNFGEKVLTQCGEGTLFNPEIQVCDWPHNVKCKNDGNSNENGSSDENSGGHENSGSGEDGGLLPNGCPSDFSIHQLLPHEKDCSKFYYCNFGEKVLTQCGEGTLFNPEIQVCDWPHNVKCKNDGNSNENGSSDENGGSGENGSSDENSGSHENSGSGEDGGLLPNGCPSDFSIHQLLPHEKDCSKFYYCNFGDKVLTQCSEGLHFNPKLQVCDWPVNAGCEVKSGESSQSGEDSNEVGDNKCKDSCNVEPWAHDDCDKFWRCAGATPVLVHCSEGLQFNKDTKTCDFKSNVNCVRNNIEFSHVNNGYQRFLPSNRVDYHTFEILRNNLH